MRLWANDAVLVVERGVSATELVHLLFDAIPEGPFRALHEFLCIEGDENVRACRVQTWSVDDELGAEVFAVVDGALQSLTVRVITGARWREERDTKVVAAGLTELVAPEEVVSLKGFAPEDPADGWLRERYERALARAEAALGRPAKG